MRGEERRSGSLFSYVDLEARVAPRHPLRLIRRIVDDVLARLDRDFAALYSPLGRRSIPPEFLLRALLLQAFYSIRSERQLMEQLDYNLLFRWFVGLGVDDPVWDASSYAKNRDRLLAGDVAAKVLAGVTEHPEVRPLLSDEHFTVDGTLIEAWASLKSFRRRDGSGEPPPSGRNAEQDFHGERRRNDTHASTTDPQAKLLRKGPGREARLCFMGHLLGENRHGLVVQAAATQASGRAEPETALALVGDLPGRHRITVGADKAFDTAGFVTGLRGLNATPHVAQCITAVRGSRIDGRTTRHPGYQQRQRRRKLIGEAFGWIKLIAGQRKSRFRGTDRVGWAFTFAAAAYNLVRIPKLLAAAP